jgi:hypothetical protein
MSIAARARESSGRALFAGVIALAVALPALGQRNAPERWVATWATALVVRPAPPAAPAAAAPTTPAAPPAAAAPARPPTAAAPTTPPTAAALAPAAAPPAPAAGPPPAGPPPGPPPLTVSNQTLRQIVHTSLGGERVRVVLSNVFGTAPLEIGAAAIAPRGEGSKVQAGAVRPLTFGGRATAAILPGAVLVSDPVAMTVAPLSDLAIDLYLPGDVGVGLARHDAQRRVADELICPRPAIVSAWRICPSTERPAHGSRWRASRSRRRPTLASSSRSAT